ncbi:hypothetical protein ACJO5Y_11270 [Marinobacter sp. GN3S48]
MKKSRFSDSQVLSILKQAENGVPVSQEDQLEGTLAKVSVKLSTR